jgi:2-dehydro-3-deoxyphosphooctonate aldolase (KDO 8-P synthase)
MKSISVGNFKIGKNEPLCFICGPCVIESEDSCLSCAESLQSIFSNFPFNFIFKSSFDKANRSSITSFRGPGIDEGMNILSQVRKQTGASVTTDIHLPMQASIVSEVCDMIQLPAFLCRQTDLIIAAGATDKCINIKKGQFMAPWDMEQVVKKLESTGNKNILLTDRGTSFGYNNLVTDFRCIPIMQEIGYPVCYDATHSQQMPGGLGTTTGGDTKFTRHLSRAAVASGVNSIFIETHPDPSSAKCDATTVLSFEELKKLLQEIESLYDVMQKL